MAYLPIRTLVALRHGRVVVSISPSGAFLLLAELLQQAKGTSIDSGTEVRFMNGEVSVVALVRGEEKYIFMFNEANRTETLRMLGRYAADPELSFTWYDAAILSQRIRELMPAASIGLAPKNNTVHKNGNHPSCSHSFPLPGPSDTPSAPKKKSPSTSPTPRFRLPNE